MPTELGNLVINIEGNDAPLRALLAKYQSGQTIKVGVNASGLGATDAAIKGLTANMQALTNAITAAGTAQSRSFAPTRDTGLQAAARGVKILSDEYRQGGLSAAEYAQRSTQLRTTLELLGQTAQPLSRQMATVQSALAQLSAAEGQAGRGSPIADRFRLESAAAKQATETMNVYRLAWQRKTTGDVETVNSMKLLEKGILAQKAAYEQEAKALEAKGVLDKAETARLAELTTLQNRLGQALRTSASVQAEVNGEFLKGSLGMNVQRGVAAALKDTAAETERLINAERAGLVSKAELRTGLAGQVAEQKAALSTIEAEITATRNLGLVQVQNVTRLVELRDAQNGYTRALAETTAAQERAAGLTARGALLGGAGLKAGLNDAGMALSFVSPQAGMLGMAASMGPVVAGAAAIGLGLGAIVKLTRDGQSEAKALQQAYLVMSANGIRDIKGIDDSLNQIVTHGNDAEKMFSKSELATALASLARGGVTGADAMKVLAVSSRLAAAEHISLGDATTRLYGNLQHFSLSADEAAGFGDKLARASHMSMATMDDLSKGLIVVGQVMKGSGFSTSETLGMLVDLAKKGMDPATVGANGLKNAILAIEHPSKTALADFAALGIATQTLSGHARNGHDILMDLQAVLSSTGPIYDRLTGHLITHDDAVKMVFDTFRSRGATAFLSVLGNVKDLTAEVENSKGFLQNYSDTVVGGLQGAQARLDSATKNLSLTFAQLFTPALTEVVKWVQQGVTDLNSFVGQLAHASDGVDRFAQLKISADDSPLMVFFKTLNNAIQGTRDLLDGVSRTLNQIGEATGLHAIGDFLTRVLPGSATPAQKNRTDQQAALQALSAAKAQLPLLEQQLAEARKDPRNAIVPGGAPAIDNILTRGGPAPASKIQELEAAIGRVTKLIGTTEAQLAALRTASGIGGGFAAGPGTLPLKTGDRLADNLVDYCSRWVRISLEKANPQLTGALSKLFGGTADISKGNFKAAGLLHPFTGITDLKPGDTVFYDNNHVGVYIGNGMVRGNNRLTNAATGGKDPVGDNYIGSLGSIAGFARLSEIAQRMGLDPAKVSPGTPVLASAKTPPEMDPNFKAPPLPPLKELQTEMLKLTAAYKSGKMDIDAYHASVEALRSKASALADTQRTGSKEWTSTEKFIIQASNALKVHTAATQQAALTWAQYKPLREQALKLAQQESDMNDHKLTPQAETALKGTLQRYRDDPVRALALEQASQELTDRQKRAEDAQKSRDQQAAEAKRQAAEARQLASDQAAFHKNLDRQTSDQAITTAQARLKQLTSARDAALADDKKDAAARLQIERDQGPAILALQQGILLKQRDQAIQAAHDTAEASRAAADKTYKGKTPLSVLRGINQIETGAGNAARASYTADLATAQSEQDRRVNGLQATLTAEHDKAVKDQEKARQDVVQSLREQDIAGATQHLAHLKQLRDAEVQNAGDNVMKALAIQKRYASDLETSAEAIVRAQYRVDVAAAKNGDLHLKAGRLQVAESKLSQGLAEAEGSDTVSTASDKVTSAIQKQRDAYHQLAETLRQHVAAGDLDAQTQHDLLLQFNALGRETEKLGLTTNPLIVQARTVTYALNEQAHAAFLTAARMSGMVAGNTDAADSALTLASSLQGVGEEQAGLDVLQTTYDHLMDALARGEASADSVNKVRVALDALKASLNLSDEFNGFVSGLSGTIDEQMQVITDKLGAAGLDPKLRENLKAFRDELSKGLNPAGNPYAAGLIPGANGFQGQGNGRAFLDNLDKARSFISGIGTQTGAALQTEIAKAVEYLNSDIGKTLPSSVRDALQAGIDGAQAGLKSLNEVLANPEQYRDGGKGLPPAFTDPTIQQGRDRANQQAITSAGWQAESTALDSQHNRNLIREKDYLEQRRSLDERAALQSFLDADHAGENHAVILAKYSADMLAIQARYNDATYSLDQKEHDAALAAANQHASSMLALERSSAAARLQFQHGQGSISDRAFIAAEQQQAEQAALDKYLAAFNTAGSDMVLAWAQYQADLTAASEKGTTDRQALMQTELAKWAGYAGQVGGIFKKFSGGGDSVGSIAMDYIGMNLNAARKALKGDIVGATLDWLNGLGDVAEKLFGINGQVQAQKKTWTELAAAEQAAMGSKSYGGNSILNPFYDRLQKDSAALTSKVNAGFWQRLGWSIFGGAPKTLKDSEARALTQAGTVFNDFASSLYGALESALMNAFDSGNFDGVAAAVEKSLNDLVAKMYLQTLIAKSSIAADLKTLADDQSAGRDISADVTRLKGDASSITQQFQQGASALPGFGANPSGATGSSASGSAFGAAPAAVEFSLPPMVFQGFQSFDASAVMFSGSVTTFDAAIRRLEAAFDRGMGLEINLAQGATQLQGSTTAAFR